MLIKFTAVLFIDIFFKCSLYQQAMLMKGGSYSEISYVLFRIGISICHAVLDSYGSVYNRVKAFINAVTELYVP
jgi:hypothetical protein